MAAHDAGVRAHLLERVLKREGVHDGGQHAHVVRRDAVHLLGRGSDSAEEITAPDNHPDLHSGAGHVGDFSAQSLYTLGVDTEPLPASAITSPLSFSRIRLYFGVGGHGRLLLAADLEAGEAGDAVMFSPSLAIFSLTSSSTVRRVLLLTKGCCVKADLFVKLGHAAFRRSLCSGHLFRFALV